MRIAYRIILFNFILGICIHGFAQNNIPEKSQDSLTQKIIQEYKKRIEEVELQRVADSVKRRTLEYDLSSLKLSETSKREKLQKQLQEISDRETQRIALQKARIESIRQLRKGDPVVGILKDTIFYIYARFGSSTTAERAQHITNKIRALYDDDLLNIDSIKIDEADNSLDIIYGENIIASISETDALWNNMSAQELAGTYQTKIKNALLAAREENNLQRKAIRAGLIVLVISLSWLMIWLIGKAHQRLLRKMADKKDSWFRSFVYKDYTYLTADQEMNIVLFLIKVFRWILSALLLYIIITILFSILIYTRGWAISLFNLVWLPFKGILSSLWQYMPNLFRILVIFFVMKYFLRFVKYIFSEIEDEKLKVSGFQPEWAMPTYSIVNFLLYAFTFVLIFPYLPGSDSNIFKGVSVFIGVLFSFGSSSAIANIISGLVITYMSPFRIGDRIKVGEVTGDVVEKSLLITRLKTTKNEEITLPNTAMLSGNIINYSSHARTKGLIIHSTVTIGYDTPWKDMHQALIDAALRTENILKDPSPFVLQTALNDFYVSYQINGYINTANRQEMIYSLLHQNIQDVCNERGIEILSPHYRYQRDGNMTSIPSQYLKDDYVPPSFTVRVKKEEEK